MRGDLDDWQVGIHAAWLFGSAARGDAGPDSDIDVLFVRSDASSRRPEADDERWESQIQRFIERVQMWSVNPCEVLDLTVADIRDAVVRDDRRIRDLRDHAIPLRGVGAPTGCSSTGHVDERAQRRHSAPGEVA